MSNKAWPLHNFFLREVSKLFKCYVLVKNFDQKPAILLKTLKIGFSARYSDNIKVLQGAAVIKSFYIFRLSRNPCAFMCFCFQIYVFNFKKLAVTKTTFEFITSLQDPFKDTESPISY